MPFSTTVVLGRFLARVGQPGDRGAGDLRHQLGEIAHPVRLGHLVEDLHPLAAPRAVRKRQLDAAHRVLDVDEGAGLAARAVHRQRIVDRRLDQEAVEHRAVVAVIVEPVDELRDGGASGRYGCPRRCPGAGR